MATDLLSIGQLARLSKLSITAVRYYADSGVLVPHTVDPHNGYRLFHPDQVRDARLLHELRKLGLPVRTLRTLVRADPFEVEAALDARLEELRQDVARSELVVAAIRTIVRSERSMATCTVPRADLVNVLDRVLPAVGSDPKRPRLHSLLLELEGTTLRLVGTDSYRLSLGEVVCSSVDGADTSAAVDARAFAEAVGGTSGGDATIDIRAESVTVVAGDHERSLPLAGDFPDYQKILLDELGPPKALVEVELEHALETIGQADSQYLVLDAADGTCSVTDDDGEEALVLPASGEAVRVAASTAFVVDALRASVGPDAIVEMRAAERPLVVRSATDGSFTTLVMPMRVDRRR